MEEFGAAKPIINAENITPDQKEQNGLIETKNYKLNLDNDTFLLTIETFPNENIDFKVKQINELSISYFYKKYSFEEILQKLYLYKEFNKNISNILKFIDASISQNKMILIKDKEKKIKLSLKRIIDLNEIDCIIELDEIKLKNEELVQLLFNEMKEIKSKGIGKGDDQNVIITINQLKKELEQKNKEKEEMKKKIDLLIEENNKMKDNFEKYKKYVEEKLNDLKNKDINFFTEINNENFIQNPINLKYNEILTTNHSNAGKLSNFEVFTGSKDNIPYLVYHNEINFNLEVMRLTDNTIVHFLKKHTGKITVINYYKKNNDNEYLLSCDLNKLVVIWEIQNNFNIKSSIQEEYVGVIWDAHLLLDLNNKDYILLSSGKKEESIKLYELKDNNCHFIKNIFGTKENITNYMIPWFYNFKYYVINFYNDISIHNIFENECYAKLTVEKSSYFCGFIYNKNYLCANDRTNNLLRIWDLINKNIVKEIKYDGELGREIIQWNNTYTIIACKYSVIIINLEKGEMISKISIKRCIGGVKKIYLDRAGECLIVSDFNNTILLFRIMDN